MPTPRSLPLVPKSPVSLMFPILRDVSLSFDVPYTRTHPFVCDLRDNPSQSQHQFPPFLLRSQSVRSLTYLHSLLDSPRDRDVIGAGLWSASLGLSLQPKRPWSRYSIRFPSDSNPRPGFSASSGISGWSAGVWVSMGAGHVMAYAAIGLR